MRFYSLILLVTCLLPLPAKASFILSSAIVEFTSDGADVKDVEIISRSDTTQYISAELYVIDQPELEQQPRIAVEDPEQAGLLVTPLKAILPAGSRKTLRLVSLQPPGQTDRIYRVAVKPSIRGVENTSHIGVKVLVGYEILVIARPAVIHTSYNIERQGRTLMIRNDGNSNILLQSGRQCMSEDRCATPPHTRIYAGQSLSVALKYDAPLSYTVWDGVKSETVSID